ncbi:site-2 protease family protein [Desulfitobacterium metallireducens]|uniref:Zn-dependent protease n=1 Tax=Desulfitobacterium metallireducens DSM 15288 TaxID=871968 RepID=W0EDP3_9FIRM|nr:site-2 protease family protein [Desulfitobacterium metallireducens]AHF07314.1 Zn-dependent protease [Desulfitobacterium metallireducens DSM 15288]
MPGLDLTTIIANVPALLIGFAFHEYAHAYVADRLGDPTPRSQGRLTMNPFAHLDLFGTLMAVFFQFGWAKPVQTHPQYYKGNPTRGNMLVAIAGPFMNLCIAFIGMVVWVILLHSFGNSSWMMILSKIMMALVLMNLGLGVFNLLPIPPLDGFSILGWILPDRFSNFLHILEQYGMVILMLVLFTNILGSVLFPLVGALYSLYQKGAIALLSPILGF